ncbi:putative haloalkane dehalogenase [Hyaloraphidium curvatum]|nr:putative haloalkane dehalogenase [Hyaloraphidium curvatum]
MPPPKTDIRVPPPLPDPSIVALRTPESAFHETRSLFPYEPKYLEWGHLRMAYYDERGPVIDLSTGKPLASPPAGVPVNEEVWLCLHGEPAWSFLYRNMIPAILSSSGRPHPLPGRARKLVRRRAVALDLLGFGRSDKPKRMEDYGFAFHLHSLIHAVLALDLREVTALVQDWGGLLGLCLPQYLPGRFRRYIVMDTALPLGLPPNKGFLEWKEYGTKTMEGAFVASKAMSFMMRESTQTLDEPGVKEAYDAPYPTFEHTAGACKFPHMVPLDESYGGVDVGKMAGEFWSKGEGNKIPIFMAIGMKDLVIEPRVMYFLRNRFLTSTVATMELPDAGHFVQEWGERIIYRALDVFEALEVDGVVLGSPAQKGKL